jgi:hypothetical protein
MGPRRRPDTRADWTGRNPRWTQYRIILITAGSEQNTYLPALTNDRPDLSSERAPPNDKTVTFQKKKEKEIISGQKSQIGLDTKTY